MTEETLAAMEAIVREAGAILMKAHKGPIDIAGKDGHANFVTQYDRAVQDFLVGRLQRLVPEARFLGEEEGLEVFRDEYRSGYLFVIDPIDGTSNFIAGYFPSTISVGLFRDGRPWAGVIYNPWSDQMFAALKGRGSRMNGQAIHVLDRPLRECLVSFGTSPYHTVYHRRTFEIASAYLEKCVDLRRSGCASWDLCQLACGKTGLYMELDLGLYDFAAGVLIVEEAGGTVTQMNGRPLTYDGRSSVLAVSAGISRNDILYTDEMTTS